MREGREGGREGGRKARADEKGCIFLHELSKSDVKAIGLMDGNRDGGVLGI